MTSEQRQTQQLPYLMSDHLGAAHRHQHRAGEHEQDPYRRNGQQSPSDGAGKGAEQLPERADEVTYVSPSRPR